MPRDAEAIQSSIRELVAAGAYRVTRHAHEEMVAEDISLADVFDAIGTGVLIEDYADHRRGPCCLLSGATRSGRPLHVVCSTEPPVIILVTVYEPKPPRWETPRRRGGGR